MSSSMANPFDILPANLFNLFSTQGITTLQRHYIAILLRVYTLAEFNRLGLARENVINDIVDYLKTEQAESEVAAEMAAEHGAADSDSQAVGGQTSQYEYAGYILRRLHETGWIEREQQANYNEIITLPDYAFTLLEALRTIQEQKPREFKGQLYTAHKLIMSSRNDDFSPALALPQAYENVRQLVRGLNELNQNIRRYIERATRGRDVAELLRLQFDDYSQTLGPTYHALKTSDHVSRYRRDIVGRLQSWQRNAPWLERAADDLATHKRLSPAQAHQEIEHYIHSIIHQLESLDPLIEEIDRRHGQYLRVSLRQIRYQLINADGSFKDRLVSIARGLAAFQMQGETLMPDEMPPLHLHPVRSPDADSFYTPPKRRAPFAPAQVVASALLPADLAALRATTMQDVLQALTPDKVNKQVLDLFNGHRTLHVNDLPANILNDMHHLTTIIAYSHHPEVGYGIEIVDGDAVKVGNYNIVPFQLTRLSNI